MDQGVPQFRQELGFVGGDELVVDERNASEVFVKHVLNHDQVSQGETMPALVVKMGSRHLAKTWSGGR